MKFFSYSVFILCFLFCALTQKLGVKRVDNMCSDLKKLKKPYISNAFRWGTNLYFFLKESGSDPTDKGIDYRMVNFTWDGSAIKYKHIDQLGEGQDWDNIHQWLMFSTDYPERGEQVVVMGNSTVGGKNELVAQLISIKYETDQTSETILEGNPITLNPYKCTTEADALSFCTIFPKFPAFYGYKDISSILPFPKSTVLPRRLFVYFTEIPPEKLIHDCDDDLWTTGGCWQAKRFLFVGQNEGNPSSGFKWINVNTPAKCVDLKRTIVNASTLLTDYRQNGDRYHFDMIEYFGSKFRIFRISVTKEKMIEEFELLKEGPFDWMFGCSQLSNTTIEPDVPVTEPDELSTQSDDEFTDGSATGDIKDVRDFESTEHTEDSESTEYTKAPEDKPVPSTSSKAEPTDSPFRPKTTRKPKKRIDFPASLIVLMVIGGIVGVAAIAIAVWMLYSISKNSTEEQTGPASRPAARGRSQAPGDAVQSSPPSSQIGTLRSS